MGILPTKQHIYNLAAGFSMASAVLASAFLLASGFDVALNPSNGRAANMLLIGTLSLSTAIFEELVFRYWLTSYLIRKLNGVIVPILVSSAVFALLHLGNNHVTGFAIGSHFVGGVVYAAAFVLSRSIWLPIGLHFGWNLTQYLFSHPMSGSLKEGLFSVELPANSLWYGGAYGIEAGWTGVLCRIVVFLLCLAHVSRASGLATCK